MSIPDFVGYAPADDEPAFNPAALPQLGARRKRKLEAAGAPTVSLIDQWMPPVRDPGQGRRNTCVAFVAATCLEYYRARTQGAALDASEQFLYWAAVQFGAQSLGTLFPHLAQTGVCREETWRYHPDEIPGNPGQDPPPESAQAEALQYRCQEVGQANDLQQIVSLIRGGRPVGIGVAVFLEWWRDEATWRSGVVPMPKPGWTRMDLDHAITLVGYAPSAAPGNGYFIFRNSFGAQWGPQGAFGAGYGVIPFGYVLLSRKTGWYIRS